MYRKLETNKEFEKLITKTKKILVEHIWPKWVDTKLDTNPTREKTTRPKHDTKINGSESGRHETDPNPSDLNPNDTNPTQIASLILKMVERVGSIRSYFVNDIKACTLLHYGDWWTGGWCYLIF